MEKCKQKIGFLFVIIFVIELTSAQNSIKLSGNITTLNIKEITSNLKLENIDLSQNEIKRIENPGILRNHRLLKNLTLDSNLELNVGKDEIFLESESVEILNCKMCGFTEIWEVTFTALPNLKRLDLALNKILRINGQAFLKNPNLEKFAVSRNKIKEIPVELFSKLEKFQEFEISNNPIKLATNQAFLKSSSLRKFRCQYCEIHKIYEASFSELKFLELLDLNHNFIEILPANALKFNEQLKSFFVEHNRLKAFPKIIVDYLPSLEELCIDDNDFQLNKEIQELIEIYNNRTLRSNDCDNQNTEQFFELKYLVTNPEVTATPATKDSSFIPRFINEGISDLFIGSYLTIILIIQVAVLVVLTIYLIKIVKYETVDGDVDYSTTILNENDIYKVYNSRD